MFKGRTAILLGLALLMALGAAWVAKRWLQNLASLSATGPDIAHVVVASRDIPFGAKIDETYLQLAVWPKNTLPKDHYTDIKPIIGEISTQTIYKGDVINKARIRDHLGGSPLSALIEQNMRAVSVRVNDVVGVSGFLLPGNRVDVLATRRPNATFKTVSTQTLLEDIKVLAVDQEASQEKDKPVVVRSVTLEVRPDQAELLARATEEGTIQLSLRNPLDHQLSPPKEMVEDEPPKEEPPKEATPPKAEVPLPKVIVPEVVEKKPPTIPTRSVLVIKGSRIKQVQCTTSRCDPS